MRRLSVKVARVSFDENYIYVSLFGGGIIAVPLHWLPTLAAASPAQRERYELRSTDELLCWPDLGVTLSLPDLLGREAAQAQSQGPAPVWTVRPGSR